MKSLRPQRARKFAARFVSNGFNGTQAVVDCGITQNRNSAHVIGHRLLQNVTVQNMIEDAILKAKMNADDVLEELSDIARTKTPTDGNQKLKALELLGKAHKLFVDRVESTDTSSATATESALLKSIALAASRDAVSESDSAVQLYLALKDDPQFADVSVWPEKYREAILASQVQSSEQVTESELVS